MLLGAVFALLLLAACTPPECNTNSDCTRKGHTSRCVSGNCEYAPIPGTCGNTQCEANVNENKCGCPDDCGKCTGTIDIPGTKTKTQYLQQNCNANNQCLQDVPAPLIKPLSEDYTGTTSGATLKTTTLFNQPFNLKKDTLQATITLTALQPGTSDVTLTNLELTGTTMDNRQITLGSKPLSRKLYSVTEKITETIRFSFPTAEIESKIRSVALTVTVASTTTTGTTKITRTNPLKIPIRTDIVYVKPTVDYGCPASCDDNNPGTQDTCEPQTDHFCEHTPLAGACGNSLCEGTENKCTCPTDCGQCIGAAGKYVTYLCSNQTCLTQISTTLPAPKTVFEDKDIGLFHVENRYTYRNPFNVRNATLDVDIKLTEKRDDITVIRIIGARVLSKQQELGNLKTTKTLNTPGITVKLAIPITLRPTYEEDYTPTVIITYDYQQRERIDQGTMSKVLEQITFINPTG